MKLILLNSFLLLFSLSDIFATSIPKRDKVDLKVYYETLCPHSRRFLSDMLKPAVLKLGENLVVNLYPYGKANTTKVDDHYEFHCQHGPKECYGNKLHDCAIKYKANITEVVVYTSCMVSRDGVGSDDEGADACGQSQDIPTDKIKQCAKTSEGDELHNHYGEERKKVHYRHVPYVLVNDVEYKRPDTVEEFIRDICGAFENMPSACMPAATSLCNGARMQPALQSTTPLPQATLMARSPVPLTIIQDTPTQPSPPVCADALDINTPLARLRSAMKNAASTQLNSVFDAFVVSYTDEHLSEEPMDSQRRLEYISGWDGPGTGAVLADGGAAIWVPAGDVQRAVSMVTCAWIVIDRDDSNQQTVAEWIAERLSRSGRVGGDARLTSVSEWQELSSKLQREGLQLVHVPVLIDQLWKDEPDPERRRPESPMPVAINYKLEFAGESWRDKVAAVRRELHALGADAMIVTALDEVAWLLNVRGRDLPYAPMLKAFVYISMREVRLFVPPGKLSVYVRDSLAVFNCYSQNCTRTSDYSTVYPELRRVGDLKILVPAASTFQRGASAAIAQSIAPAKRMFLLSPITYLKAQKNEAEIKGMRKAHLRDAVAMCTLLSYIENKPGSSETSVQVTVDITRETLAGYVGPSMKTRAAYGTNSADPDYRASNKTNKQVAKNSTLIIQSGGQYDEGTTIVTRTLHYGKPTKEHKRAYTLVLRALAAFGTFVAPGALPAAHADPVLRAPLWAARSDYPHATGHGVGAALNRKEDPVIIDYRQIANTENFREGYFITVEPAWYEAGNFGVHLGNIFEVISKPNGYLGFREATLVPYEMNLIDVSILTEYEIIWLNAYNERIRKEVGPELKSRGLTDVYYWMRNKTVPLKVPSKIRCSTSAASHFGGIVKILALTILALYIVK